MRTRQSPRSPQDRTIRDLFQPLIESIGGTISKTPQRGCGTERTIRPDQGEGSLWHLVINDSAAVMTLDMHARRDIVLDAQASGYYCLGSFERIAGTTSATQHPTTGRRSLLGYAWREGSLRGEIAAGEVVSITSIYLLPEALTTIACALGARPAELASAIALLDGTRNLPRLLALFDEMREARLVPGCAEAYYRCKTVEVSAVLLDWCRRAQMGALPHLSAEDLTALNVARLWAMGHLDTPICLDELCRAACVSPTKLAALFKATEGATPMEWVRDMRMERACELLVQTADQLGSIAAQVGFTRHGSFSAAFKGRFGMTPNQYRALHRDERASPMLEGALLDR